MTRQEIIGLARRQLNEVTQGFWTDNELYAYGWSGEKELVNILKEEYLVGLMKEETAYSNIATTLTWIDGDVHIMPTDFLRLIEARSNTGNRGLYTLIEGEAKNFYGTGRKMRDFSPGIGGGIGSYIMFWHALGLAVCPAVTMGGNFTLVYYKVPDEWLNTNDALPPNIKEGAHELLSYYIVWKALLEDGEMSSAKAYEAKYKEACILLGTSI
ncbi:MAG: hypothetical protein COS71_03035 [Candidatus Moranbacteria bacterium CG06_land_8_20_14_3_00_40_12]|nr:MAG: hypothetical protein COS71_03035 [Candidatus Moranbacteria bacterium CG06_land_8_20_14_3_00_40_12]